VQTLKIVDYVQALAFLGNIFSGFIWQQFF